MKKALAFFLYFLIFTLTRAHITAQEEAPAPTIVQPPVVISVSPMPASPSVSSPPPPPTPAVPPSQSQQPRLQPAQTVVPSINLYFLPPAATQDVLQIVVPQPARSNRPIRVMPGIPYPYSWGTFYIQLGSFSHVEHARLCYSRVRDAGFTPIYQQYGNFYRVIIGGLKAADIPWIIQRLDAYGFAEAWIRQE